MHPLTHELVDFLLSREADEALNRLAGEDLGEGASLARIVGLRARFSPGQAAALLDQARLRVKAASKFPEAMRLFFEDEALQQATTGALASYRAAKFEKYGFVADLGCGIGGDALALARAVPRLVAVDRDPIRARLARANMQRLGLGGRAAVVCADWTTLRLGTDACFADPSRRREGRRLFRLRDMEPGIEAVLAIVRSVHNVAVKVAPGIQEEEIPQEAEVEFISEAGEMKEALLLFGGLRCGASRAAVLLPGPHRMASTAASGPVAVVPPSGFLYEPDPAILRAGLVRPLASALGAAQIDETIAYLTSDEFLSSPFIRGWRILRHGPFGLKGLNAWLKELSAGEVVVKKRGSPVDTEAFRRRLKTAPHGRPITAFLTRSQGRPWMIVGEASLD